MTGAINASELNPDTLKKLKLETKVVPDRTIALGKVFTALQGLTTRDAYWVLRTATTYVPGYKRTPTHTRPTSKPRNKKRLPLNYWYCPKCGRKNETYLYSTRCTECGYQNEVTK